MSPAFAAGGVCPISDVSPSLSHGSSLCTSTNGGFNAPGGSAGKAEAVVRVGDWQDSPVLSPAVGSWNSSPGNAVLPHGLISFQIQKWFIFDPVLSSLTFCCFGNTSFFISIFGLWIEQTGSDQREWLGHRKFHLHFIK